jgi:hypothetical protein
MAATTPCRLCSDGIPVIQVAQDGPARAAEIARERAPDRNSLRGVCSCCGKERSVLLSLIFCGSRCMPKRVGFHQRDSQPQLGRAVCSLA